MKSGRFSIIAGWARVGKPNRQLSAQSGEPFHSAFEKVVFEIVVPRWIPGSILSVAFRNIQNDTLARACQ